MVDRRVPDDFDTIEDALELAQYGDVIVLAENYYGPEDVNVSVSGITITGPATATGINLFLEAGVKDFVLLGEAPINVTDTPKDTTSLNESNNISGNDGDNTITLTGGIDVVDGGDGPGTDWLVVDYSWATVAITGTATSFEVAGNSITYSSFEHFKVLGGTAADQITLSSGNNYIDAGEGANSISAGNGDNVIKTGATADSITVGAGNNSIFAGGGVNTIITGAGNNLVSTGDAADTVTTGGGNDIIKDTGGAGTVTAAAGHDRLILDYSELTAAVTNTLTGAEPSYGGIIAGTTFSGVEEFHVTGSSNNDNILTGAGSDVLDGGAGADTLTSGGGSDVIYGGVGDVVDGGEDDGTDLNDFDVLVLNDFGDYRIDYATVDGDVDTESGIVVQLADGIETGSVEFTGIESIEFTNNIVTTSENTQLVGNLPLTADTTVTTFAMGNITGDAGSAVSRTEGVLEIEADGSYIFTPASNYNGPAPVINYTDSDGVISSLRINVSPADESATLDTTAPDAPTVSIAEDTDNDGLISGGESSGQVDVTIALPAGAVAGDRLTITNPDTGTTAVDLSAADITAGDVSVTYDVPAEGGTMTVSAVITDAAGNTSAAGSDSATLDTTAPDAPTVSIAEDTDNDGLISGGESSGQVDVTIALPAGAVAGDRLTITNPDTGTTAVDLSAADITAGDVSVTYDVPAEGGTMTVSAVITDAAGNTSAAGSDSATLDTTAPDAPTVSIAEDTDNDGLISGGESSGQVDVTIALPAGAVAGDRLTITNPDTGTTAVDLSAADITAGDVSVTYDVPAEGGTMTVSAVITDAAGNTSAAGSDSATLDTTAPDAPTVSIAEDTDNDGLISGGESSGQVDVTIALPAGAVAGDRLTITNPDTGTTAVDLSAADITAGDVSVTYDVPAEGGTMTVSAVITDAAGNTSAAGSDSATLDTTAPDAPTVSIAEDTDNDGLISGGESSGQVDVTIALPAGAVAGDRLTITNPDTGTTAVDLSAADITAGDVSVTYDVPAEGGTMTVSAVITDAAGNTSAAGSDSATLDTTAPDAPTVSIAEDTDNDGLISGGESSGQVDVTIALPAGAVAGDRLTITNPDTGTTAVDLSAADITAGDVSVTYDVPAEGGTMTVSAVITDAAGNTSAAGSDSATLDTTAPDAPTVSIAEDTDNDGLISGGESSGQVDVTIALPAGAVAGDRLTITNPDTGTTAVDLSAADITAGDVSVTYDVPAEGGTMTVSAVITDAAGNTSAAGSDSATLDTTAPDAPTVSIAEDTDNDGLISGGESSGQVDVTIALPAGAVAGDRLTITNPDTGTTAVDLSAADITAGDVSVTYDVPAEGGTMTVSAVITDAAGNTSAAGSDSATLDTTAPDAPTVSIAEDTDNDGLISGGESSGQVDVTIALPAGAVAGDRLTITNPDTGTTAVDLSAADITAGDVSVTYDVPAEGGTMTVSAVITDAAGNTSAAGSDSATLDTTASDAPTVSIAEDTDNDGLISGGESSGQVDVTIALPAGAVAGDRLTITNPDTGTTAVDLSAADITAGDVSVTYDVPAEGGTMTVSAVITDAAGNTSAAGSDSSGVNCFAEGTLITTAGGEIPIEDLQVGDLIQTLDRGLQPLRWIGHRHLDARELAEKENLCPIRISQNVIGHENCDRDLVVSPQHRVLIASRVAERMFGSTEVIVAAKHLLAIEGVDIATDLKHVTYFHILLDEHAIVYANKVPAESLYLGYQAQLSLSVAGRAEIFALFPEVASPSFIPTSCRPIIGNKRARKLAQRHMKNNKSLLHALSDVSAYGSK
ncbi:hypothetical protein OAN307_c42750 [Octadecabacter antarcticus 307]|uniref:Hedgehog/Intein (Hint) domain-containing protein n=1 Tax=Octadecabacter antarcticus 307 TaxID=391626 RepID=M9RD30_9RHOB|nr:Hint domain-containing protein [Octadecabacter antarcticus]AGI69668.1 hypothetical protein OAN307_c42750 [Octadecabacter antarcticus 307]